MLPIFAPHPSHKARRLRQDVSTRRACAFCGLGARSGRPDFAEFCALPYGQPAPRGTREGGVPEPLPLLRSSCRLGLTSSAPPPASAAPTTIQGFAVIGVLQCVFGVPRIYDRFSVGEFFNPGFAAVFGGILVVSRNMGPLAHTFLWYNEIIAACVGLSESLVVRYLTLGFMAGERTMGVRKAMSYGILSALFLAVNVAYQVVLPKRRIAGIICNLAMLTTVLSDYRRESGSMVDIDRYLLLFIVVGSSVACLLLFIVFPTPAGASSRSCLAGAARGCGGLFVECVAFVSGDVDEGGRLLGGDAVHPSGSKGQGEEGAMGGDGSEKPNPNLRRADLVSSPLVPPPSLRTLSEAPLAVCPASSHASRQDLESVAPSGASAGSVPSVPPGSPPHPVVAPHRSRSLRASRSFASFRSPLSSFRTPSPARLPTIQRDASVDNLGDCVTTGSDLEDAIGLAHRGERLARSAVNVADGREAWRQGRWAAARASQLGAGDGLRRRGAGSESKRAAPTSREGSFTGRPPAGATSGEVGVVGEARLGSESSRGRGRAPEDLPKPPGTLDARPPLRPVLLEFSHPVAGRVADDGSSNERNGERDRESVVSLRSTSSVPGLKGARVDVPAVDVGHSSSEDARTRDSYPIALSSCLLAPFSSLCACWSRSFSTLRSLLGPLEPVRGRFSMLSIAPHLADEVIRLNALAARVSEAAVMAQMYADMARLEPEVYRRGCFFPSAPATRLGVAFEMLASSCTELTWIVQDGRARTRRVRQHRDDILEIADACQETLRHVAASLEANVKSDVESNVSSALDAFRGAVDLAEAFVANVNTDPDEGELLVLEESVDPSEAAPKPDATAAFASAERATSVSGGGKPHAAPRAVVPRTPSGLVARAEEKTVLRFIASHVLRLVEECRVVLRCLPSSLGAPGLGTYVLVRSCLHDCPAWRLLKLQLSLDEAAACGRDDCRSAAPMHRLGRVGSMLGDNTTLWRADEALRSEEMNSIVEERQEEAISTGVARRVQSSALAAERPGGVFGGTDVDWGDPEPVSVDGEQRRGGEVRVQRDDETRVDASGSGSFPSAGAFQRTEDFASAALRMIRASMQRLPSSESPLRSAEATRRGSWIYELSFVRRAQSRHASGSASGLAAIGEPPLPSPAKGSERGQELRSEDVPVPSPVAARKVGSEEPPGSKPVLFPSDAPSAPLLLPPLVPAPPPLPSRFFGFAVPDWLTRAWTWTETHTFFTVNGLRVSAQVVVAYAFIMTLEASDAAYSALYQKPLWAAVAVITLVDAGSGASIRRGLFRVLGTIGGAFAGMAVTYIAYGINGGSYQNTTTKHAMVSLFLALAVALNAGLASVFSRYAYVFVASNVTLCMTANVGYVQDVPLYKYGLWRILITLIGACLFVLAGSIVFPVRLASVMARTVAGTLETAAKGVRTVASMYVDDECYESHERRLREGTAVYASTQGGEEQVGDASAKVSGAAASSDDVLPTPAEPTRDRDDPPPPGSSPAAVQPHGLARIRKSIQTHIMRRPVIGSAVARNTPSPNALEISQDVGLSDDPLPNLAQTVVKRSIDLEMGEASDERRSSSEVPANPGIATATPVFAGPSSAHNGGEHFSKSSAPLHGTEPLQSVRSPSLAAPSTLDPTRSVSGGETAPHDDILRSSLYPEPEVLTSLSSSTARVRIFAWFARLFDAFRRAWAPPPGPETWRSQALFGPATERVFEVMSLPRKMLTLQYKHLPGLRYEMRTTHVVDRLLFRSKGHAPSGGDGFILLRVTRRVLCLLSIPAHDLDAHSTRRVRLPFEAQNNVAAAFVQYAEALQALARFLRAKGRDGEVWERQEETVACVVAFRRLAFLVSAHGLLLRGDEAEGVEKAKSDTRSPALPSVASLKNRASVPFSIPVRLPEVDRDRIATLCYFFLVSSTALQSLAMVCIAYLFGPQAAERALSLLDAEDHVEGGIADVLQDAHMARAAPGGARRRSVQEDADRPERA